MSPSSFGRGITRPPVPLDPDLEAAIHHVHRLGSYRPRHLGSGRLLGVVQRPVHDILVRGEPDIGTGSRVPNELFENPDARAIADDMRVHRQLKYAALFVGGI